MPAVDYSIVIPVYNSQGTLTELCNRIGKVFRKLGNSYEIVLVDDGSADDSWQLMQELRDDPRIRIIRLSRNFGQHNATICGFRHCQGNYVVTLDDDLQHCPEEIPRLIDKMEEGFPVVIARFEVKEHALWKNASSYLKNMLERCIFKTPKTLTISGFKLIRHDVVEKIAATTYPNPYLPAYIYGATEGAGIVNVTVEHDRRKVGKSQYTLWRLLTFTWNLIVTYAPLSTIFGLLAGPAIGLCILLAKVSAVGKLGGAGITLALFGTSVLAGLILTAVSVIGIRLIRDRRLRSADDQFVVAEKRI